MKSNFLTHYAALLVGALASFALVTKLKTESPTAPLPDLGLSDTQSPQETSENNAYPLSHTETTANDPSNVPLIGNIVDDFQKRYQYAKSFTSTRRQRWELERLFHDMSPEDAPKVLEQIYDLSSSEFSIDLRDPFFARWGEIDGTAALAAAQALDPLHSYSASKAVFNTWAQTNLSEAWFAAQDFLESENRKTANIARGVLKAVAQNEPDILIGMINRGEKPHLNLTMRDKLVEAAMDYGRQRELLKSIPFVENPVERFKLTEELFSKWSRSAPDEAIEALERLDNPEQADVALDGYMKGWSNENPNEAFDYILKNQDEPKAGMLTKSLIIRKILGADAQATQETIKQIEAAGLLDTYGTDLVRFIKFRDPEAANRLEKRLEK